MVAAISREELSSELTRIINCPYPASLSKVAGLLACADVLTLQGCIHDQPPCAVAKLTALVCEALPLWPYALSILKSLCHSDEFRDTLLLQNPGLLESLLSKANTSHQDFEEYSELCVLLLSRQMPDALPLPASAQSFFLHVFDRATRAPDVCTLRPIYCMLNGACRGLVSILPSDTRQKFDRELCQILSSNGTGQNSLLLLWCFGIVLLVEHPHDVGKVGDQQQDGFHVPPPTVAAKRWVTASGRKLFGSIEGMYKTVTLTYLSVIWATKGDVGVSDIEAIGGIQIATRTLAFVDHQIRSTWPQSSSLAKGIFPKLPSKLLRVGINPGVQIEALTFYAMIAGEKNLPCEIVAQYEFLVRQIASLEQTSSLKETLSLSLPLFAPQMQETAVQTLLSQIVKAGLSPPSSHELSNIQVLADELSLGIPKCASLREKILTALSSSELHGLLWKFVRSVPIGLGDEALTPSHTRSKHRDLVSTIIAMLLMAIISAQGADTSSLSSLAVSLIEKQQQLACMPNRCSHAESVISPAPHVSLFQQKGTQLTGQHLQDWRHRLGAELESQSFYQRDSLLRSVAQICEELEARCHTVEEPLRHEQEKSQKLTQRVAELSQQVSSLESQVADDRFHIDGLEDEKMCTADERDALSAKLDELKSKFADANERAEKSMRSVLEDFKAKESELRSTILAHEGDICARDKEICDLESQVSDLGDGLGKKEAELKDIHMEYVSLQRKVCESQQSIDKQRTTIVQRDEEITRLRGTESELKNQLQHSETELKALAGQMSNVETSFHELVQSSEEALREIKAKHDLEIDSVAALADKQYNKVNDELQKALQSAKQLKDIHDQTCQDLQLAQDSIVKLKTKMQGLTDTCSDQEDELDELRALRRNVLASMGLANHDTAASTRHNHRRRKSTVQTQDNSKVAQTAEGFTNTAMEKVANASFTSTDSAKSGPTPKRQKPRVPVKTTRIHSPYTQRSILPSSSFPKLSSTKRAVLNPVSPNRRRTTGGYSLSQNTEEQRLQKSLPVRKRRESLSGIKQIEFNVDEFIIGTPPTPENLIEPETADDATISDL